MNISELPEPCDGCRTSIIDTHRWSETIIAGSLIVYKHNLKDYVRGCCLYAYNIGSYKAITYDIKPRLQALILDKVKPNVPKYADVNG
jgi:hypothetical protein